MAHEPLGASAAAGAAALVAQRARSATAPTSMKCRIIAIDGAGGAGKSTLAKHVATELGARVVCTDDFASWQHPLEWWPRLIEQVLDPLSHDRPGRYQRSDWETRTLAEWHDVPVAAFLVLEGVSSSRVAFASYLAFRVWVSTPRQERLRRGLVRDGQDALGLWREWMAREDEYIAAERIADATSLDGTRTTPPTAQGGQLGRGGGGQFSRGADN